MPESGKNTGAPNSNGPEYIEDVGNPAPPSDPHAMVPPQHGPTQLLDDQQLKNGGMVPVQAWMRSRQSENALRIKRHRERQEAKGLKQINVSAPEPVHTVIRELADKTKAGAPLADVINEIASKIGASPATGSNEDIEQLSARNAALEARIKQLEYEAASTGAQHSQSINSEVKTCNESNNQAPGMQVIGKVPFFTAFSRAISNFRPWFRRLLALRAKSHP